MYNSSTNEIKENKNWKTFEFHAIEGEIQKEKPINNSFTPMKVEETLNGEFKIFGGYKEEENKQISEEEYLKEIEKTIEIREQEGYEKGFAQGEKDGLELGEKKSKKIIEKIEQLFESISTIKEDIIKKDEKEILDIIIKIAEKITKTNLSMNDSSIRQNILEAIKYATEKSRIVIRINPEDLNLVEKIRPELFERFKELKSITVNSDNTIEKGGCYLETLTGDIDARIDSQLEKIADSIKNAY